MSIIIKGHVEAILRDRDGNIIAREEGKNTVVEMSNNIIMDLLYPRLGSAGSGVDAAVRPTDLTTNMTDNATFPTGALYMGPTGVANQANHTQEYSNINQIAYISVGDNVGQTSAGANKEIGDQGNDVIEAERSQQVRMIDGEHNHASQVTVYTRIIDSVSFPTAKSMMFSTTFATGQGNLANGIAEIGLWTAGNNADVNGFINDEVPLESEKMRLFARKHLTNTITKTDDGTLDINYTLTFSA